MVREINESAAASRAESLIATLGADGVRAQNPETRPRKIKKSPTPFCHALRKTVRKALWEAYGMFVAAFREAADGPGRIPTGTEPKAPRPGNR